MNNPNESDSPRTTNILFSKDARQRLLEGLQIAAQAVSVTMGPKGKTVLIQRRDDAPIVTKDGVTVSKSINLKDPVKRMGAELIREAASRTNDVAGDGTTTATVLAHAMVSEGLKLMAAGYSPILLRKGIEMATERVIEQLRSGAKALTTRDEIEQIATISANGDKQIGHLIAEAMDKVGRDGIITVEDAKGTTTSMHVVEGMQFERGFLSPYFVTNPDRQHTMYSGAHVLLTDKKISDLNDIVPILQVIQKQGVALLIIADDVDGSALQGLVLNRLKAELKVVAIKAPGHGHMREAFLKDIQALTGAKLVSSSTGMTLAQLTLADLGKCAKIVVDARTTTLVGDPLAKERVNAHVETLRSQMQDVTAPPEELANLKLRVARLASGVAVIRVGGATELEMIERKYRIEDSLNATKAAADEGIIPGGGSALLKIASTVDFTHTDPVVQHGMIIVQKACESPIRQITRNGAQSSEVVIANLKTIVEPNFGWDAATERFCDMMAAGIIDPFKVCRSALENACSVACTFLSLDAVVYDEE